MCLIINPRIPGCVVNNDVCDESVLRRNWHQRTLGGWQHDDDHRDRQLLHESWWGSSIRERWVVDDIVWSSWHDDDHRDRHLLQESWWRSSIRDWSWLTPPPVTGAIIPADPVWPRPRARASSVTRLTWLSRMSRRSVTIWAAASRCSRV